ncbi:protein SON isoform X2 [Embiotoca jacksoni]|uniref:protein SON isoform X2 n=1 Tax=Embiotoca jacksoni TaxID=100190 RepID=UPI003703BB87
MAANIEQIFQEFILNKIKEIEDQNEDKTAAEGTGAAAMSPPAGRDERDDFRGSSSQKKRKKHKKKRKRRNRAKESSSESGTELEGGAKRQPRRGTPTEAKQEQGEDGESKSRCHKQHSMVKRKKKKKRRMKDEENSSDSDSAFTLRPRDRKCDQSLSKRRQAELPDIIPKQDNSNKGGGDEERRSGRSERSPSHSCSQTHSCSVKTISPSRSKRRRRRSGSRSPSSPQRHRTCSSSSENRGDLDESTQHPLKYLQHPQPVLRNIQSEEPTELRVPALPSPDKPAQRKEENAEKQGSGTSQSLSMEPEQTAEPGFLQCKATEYPELKSPSKKKRKQSRTPQRKKEAKLSKKQKRSKSSCKDHKRRSRSKSPSLKKRSRSRSRGRKSRRSRSRSASRSRRRVTYSQRDRWKREPSHSPVLILRKNRSPSRKHCDASNSPHRISELDKEQLLEIAKANAAAMCAKAGMHIPSSLRSTVLPLALPSMAMNAAMASMTAATVTAALSNIGTLSSLLPLPSITNKPPPVTSQPNIAALEEVKRKVAKQANSISIKEFTDKCKMIVDSTGELPVALPHVSDEEDDGKPFGGSALREQKVISFNIHNTMVRPGVRSDAGMAKEFPVSSGSQHRKKEGEGLAAYGEWVPVDKTKDKAAAPSRKAPTVVPVATAASSSGETTAGVVPPEVVEHPAFVTDSDNVFPDPLLQPVDITQAVTERIKAQRRLAENPYDISAICMLSRAQEQVDAWAQSNTVPGLFTGSTGAQVLTSEELSTGGPQAWLKKDQFLRAAPVSGGVGLVAEGEKPQKQTGGLVVTKDLMGKHPVSALIELCNKRRIMQPDFVMVHHSGPDHRKNFLFKVTVSGVDYQPQTASPNKKHAKAMAATVALQALGEVPVDGPGLYTGPVFTAASTGPLFST